MRTHGRRHACETPEKREARLQQTSDDRRDSREARLEHELFDQNSVKLKMSKLHTDSMSIEVSRCITCSEEFPVLCLYSHECQRCSRDKHYTYTSCSLLPLIWILVQYHLNYKLVQDHLYCNIKSIY